MTHLFIYITFSNKIERSNMMTKLKTTFFFLDRCNSTLLWINFEIRLSILEVLRGGGVVFASYIVILKSVGLLKFDL
jgi:hypothetical protein